MSSVYSKKKQKQPTRPRRSSSFGADCIAGLRGQLNKRRQDVFLDKDHLKPLRSKERDLYERRQDDVYGFIRVSQTFSGFLFFVKSLFIFFFRYRRALKRAALLSLEHRFFSTWKNCTDLDVNLFEELVLRCP